ncbi:MAG: DUF4863 family protein [Rhodospirillales bacterium]|nr:DUF4863 family protein [Rhodospirillales bacterium]
MTVDEFQALLKKVTTSIEGKTVDAALGEQLNKEFPADSAEFQAIAAGCKTGIEEGWLCENEHGGIRYGRPIKPTDDLAGCSVDVVLMKDLKGPHHKHPNGEIDMVIPTQGDAKFDGKGAGWVVYGPDTAHNPTVTDGEAIVLYLLPGGAIEFTR